MKGVMMYYMNECLDVFLRKGVPFLIDQLFESLRSWPPVVLVIFLLSKKLLTYFVSKIRGIRFSNAEIVTQGNGIGGEGLEPGTRKSRKDGLSSKKDVPLFDIQEGVFKPVWLH